MIDKSETITLVSYNMGLHAGQEFAEERGSIPVQGKKGTEVICSLHKAIRPKERNTQTLLCSMHSKTKHVHFSHLCLRGTLALCPRGVNDPSF
jgi:hypothetical protein